MVVVNAFFVAIEFALTGMSRLSVDGSEEDPGLRAARELTERLEIHLTGCQLGISASTIILGVVAEPAVTQIIRPLFSPLGLSNGALSAVAVVTAVVLINLVHKIWGEQAPTYLGVERPEEVARRLAPALRVWSRVMLPLIRLGDGLAKLTLRAFGVEVTRSWMREQEGTVSDGDASREGAGREGGGREGAGREEAGGQIPTHGDLRRQIVEVLSRGKITRDRQREVVHALDIDRIPVRRIMIPIGDVTPLSLACSFEENLDRIGRTRHSRYPLLDREEERFVGTVYVPALFARRGEWSRGEKTLEDLATPAVRVDAELPVSELIDRLQEASQELALVEEGGRVVGMLTVTDAFEEIAGEVEDPYD